MEVLIRPISRGWYEPTDVDAISCTYNPDGFTPMSAVLVAYGLDREYFKTQVIHREEKFSMR